MDCIRIAPPFAKIFDGAVSVWYLGIFLSLCHEKHLLLCKIGYKNNSQRGTGVPLA
jgi:hypothetical protein